MFTLQVQVILCMNIYYLVTLCPAITVLDIIKEEDWSPILKASQPGDDCYNADINKLHQENGRRAHSGL